MAIISKRGRKLPKPPAPETDLDEIEILIFHSTGHNILSEDEIEEIRKVFEAIRKELDSIKILP